MRWRDLIEIIKMILFFVVASMVLLLIANELDRYQCASYERITGKETRYVNIDTCYVKTAQGFQRWDEYTARAVASEGLAGR